MRKRVRFRPAGWLAVGATAAAMSAAMVVVPSGGAAGAPEKEYTSHFETECILAPGVLNQKGVLKVSTKATGPESAAPGEEFTIKNATITVVTPKEWGETLYNVGARKAKGFVLSTVLDTTGAEPARRNIAKPAEFPAGLPFKTVVEPKEVEFTVPSEGRTFSLGAYHVTGQAGETVRFTLDTAPGYRETSPGNYESTGEGIQSETTGVNENGENVIGPLPVSCTAPAGVVEGEAPIVAPGSTSSTSSETSSTATTSTGEQHEHQTSTPHEHRERNPADGQRRGAELGRPQRQHARADRRHAPDEGRRTVRLGDGLAMPRERSLRRARSEHRRRLADESARAVAGRRSAGRRRRDGHRRRSHERAHAGGQVHLHA